MSLDGSSERVKRETWRVLRMKGVYGDQVKRAVAKLPSVLTGVFGVLLPKRISGGKMLFAIPFSRIFL